ncbi:hypothetical protein [Bartonella sp. MR30HLJHH]|uniref:hypothetical protein n=1 Tax=Bartonella sp. MR30HLJHH TaxID=3243557 RepID=UPI0035D0A942
MKKLYTTSKAPVVSDFKNSFSLYQLLFIKALSLASVIIFLSNISPVSAKNLNPNIKFQTQPAIDTAIDTALDTAFAGRESSKDEDAFKNLNPNIKFQTQPALDTALTGKESSKKESSKNVADAFSGVKSAFTSLNHQLELAEIKNPLTIEEKQNNLFLRSLPPTLNRAEGERMVTVAPNSPLTTVTFRNSEGKDRVLVNVAAGSVAKGSTNAINGSQIYEINERLIKILGGGYNVDSATGEWYPGLLPSAIYRSGRVLKSDGVQIYTMGMDIGRGFQYVARDFNHTTKALGGGAGFDPKIKDDSDAWIDPTYEISNVSEDGKVGKTSFNDVGSAFVGLDTSVKNVNTHLVNEVKKFDEKLTNIMQEVQSYSLLWDKTKGAFVATHGEKKSKTNSKITSLKNGDITSTSSDAVAGNQLHTLGSSVAKSLGGAASYENGTWVAPTFKVKTFNKDGTATDKSYDNVATAFAGVGDSFENVKNEITNQITDAKSDSLSWSDADNAFVAQRRKRDKSDKREGYKNEKIKYLADGDISASSTDAVNGSQLHTLGSSVAKSLGDIGR